MGWPETSTEECATLSYRHREGGIREPHSATNISVPKRTAIFVANRRNDNQHKIPQIP